MKGLKWILAGGCAIAIAAPANAIPAATIAAALSWITATTIAATSFVAIAVTVAVNLGLSILAASLFAPKQSSQQQDRQASVTTIQLGEQPRQGILGTAATAGTLLDCFNFGGTYGTDWEVQVLDLADHRCNALLGFYVNDTYVTFSGNGPIDGYNGQLEVYWLPGTLDQATPSILIDHGDGWTADDNLAGICGAVVAYKADAPTATSPVWGSGRPTFLWVVKGAYCYDPRKDATVSGGIGAHRWNDPSTWTYSENPIVCRYNWVRGIFAGDQNDRPDMLLIGRGLSATEAPPENVAAYANICDESVPDGAGGYEPRYRIGGVVSAGDDYITTEEMFAAACAGIIIQPQGSVEVEPGHAKSAVEIITDDDLLAGLTTTYARFRSESDDAWVNTVIPRYIEPSQKWADHAAPIRRVYDDVIADGKPREDTLSLALVPFALQAQRVGEITRRLGRLTRTATIPLGPRFAAIEEGDWIIWISARRTGGLPVYFRVEAYGLSKEWQNTLQLREIDPSVFNWLASDGLSDGAIASQQAAASAEAYTLFATIVQQVEAIGSDSMLSRGEKPQLYRDWKALDQTWTALDAKGEALDIAADERGAASTAMGALLTYLNGLVPSWTDTGQDTPIVAATFQAAWTEATDAVATLQAAIQGQPGAAGSNGLNNAPVLIYQRAASTPDLPSAPTTYTFSTKVLTGLDNGWSATIPSGDDPIYVSAATASSATATDTIAPTEWAAAELIAKNGLDGLNTASIFIYKRAASIPDLPSEPVVYTFATGISVGINNGWTTTIPGGTDPVYVTSATAISDGPADTIAATEWAAAQIFVQNGSGGDPGAPGISIAITPGALTIACTYDGTPKSGALPVTAQMILFDGTTEVHESATYTIANTGCTATVSNDSGSRGLVTLTDISDDSAKAVITASYGGRGINQAISISKTRDGKSPAAALPPTKLNAVATYDCGSVVVHPGETITMGATINFTVSTASAHVYLKVQVNPGSGFVDMGENPSADDTASPGEPAGLVVNGTWTNGTGADLLVDLQTVITKTGAGSPVITGYASPA